MSITDLRNEKNPDRMFVGMVKNLNKKPIRYSLIKKYYETLLLGPDGRIFDVILKKLYSTNVIVHWNKSFSSLPTSYVVQNGLTKIGAADLLMNSQPHPVQLDH